MDWKKALSKAVKGKKVLILGVGNDMKGDDGLGKYVLERLNTANKLFCGEMPENYISVIRSQNPDAILIIDAVDFEGNPGEIILAEAKQLKGTILSTHSMSLSIMAMMMPETEIFLLGVQPYSLGFGEKMTIHAKKGADAIAEALNRLFN